MKILICDDEQEQLESIAASVQSYALAHPSYEVEAETFSDAYDLLDALSDNRSVDIVLLDVYMPNMLGTELAREILQSGKSSVDIVFLTTSPDFAVEAFALHATDYLLKPFTQERFAETLDRIIEKRNKLRHIPILCGSDVYCIDCSDLLYVEAMNNNKQIHLVSGECITMRITMPKLYERLSAVKGLVEIGVSYIVNFRHVYRFSPTTVLLDDGTVIPIPRRLRTKLQKDYFEFYTKEVLAK